MTLLTMCVAATKVQSVTPMQSTGWAPVNNTGAVVCTCRFAEYRKDDPASFSLHQNLSFYPQFMFNLRRSPFVQVFGFGPDETAYSRMTLFRVPVQDAMVSMRGISCVLLQWYKCWHQACTQCIMHLMLLQFTPLQHKLVQHQNDYK